MNPMIPGGGTPKPHFSQSIGLLAGDGTDVPWLPKTFLVTVGLAVATFAWPASAAVMPSVSERLTGQAVPDAWSETLDGRPFTLSSLGGHPVLVTLFASWCPACQSELQEILAVHEGYAPRGLQFVGVLLDPRETPDTVVQARELLRKSPLPFPVVMMNESLQHALANTIGEFPATYFITSDGRFSTTLFGLQPRAQITTIVDRALGSGPASSGQGPAAASAPGGGAEPARGPWERSPWLALAPRTWKGWHPLVIHFPIALLVLEALVLVVSLVRPAASLEQFSRWLLTGALVSFVPVIYTGVSDAGTDLGPGWAFWNGLHDRIRHFLLLRSTISLHVLFALAVVVITIARFVWRGRVRAESLPQNQRVAFVVLTILGVWALFAAGQVGGSISHS